MTTRRSSFLPSLPPYVPPSFFKNCTFFTTSTKRFPPDFYLVSPSRYLYATCVDLTERKQRIKTEQKTARTFRTPVHTPTTSTSAGLVSLVSQPETHGCLLGPIVQFGATIQPTVPTRREGTGGDGNHFHVRGNVDLGPLRPVRIRTCGNVSERDKTFQDRLGHRCRTEIGQGDLLCSGYWNENYAKNRNLI